MTMGALVYDGDPRYWLAPFCVKYMCSIAPLPPYYGQAKRMKTARNAFGSGAGPGSKLWSGVPSIHQGKEASPGRRLKVGKTSKKWRYTLPNCMQVASNQG